MWRYAVVAHLRGALKANVLHYDGEMRHLQKRLTAEYERDFWVIHIDRLMSKVHFLRYAVRYHCRPPIATYRLLNVTDREVQFLAKIGKKLVPTQYSINEFVARLAEHVPDRYRHAIRHFGLLAPRSKAWTWAAVFSVLEQQKRSRPRRLSWRQSLWKYLKVDPLIDSRGNPMRWVRREKPAFQPGV
jgi:hypothetical protein